MMVVMMAFWYVVVLGGIVLWVVYVQLKRRGNDRATRLIRRGLKYAVVIVLALYTLVSVVLLIDQFSVRAIVNPVISFGLAVVLARRWFKSDKSNRNQQRNDS